MNSTDSVPPILFEDFLAHLRRLGFHIGIDHYMRLQTLLPHVWGQCSPEGLKSLLCPLFATSERQQEAFYGAFEDFLHFSSPRHETTSSVVAPGVAARERESLNRLIPTGWQIRGRPHRLGIAGRPYTLEILDHGPQLIGDRVDRR